MFEKNCCICSDELVENRFAIVNNRKCVCNSCIKGISLIQSSLEQVHGESISSIDNKKTCHEDSRIALRPKEIKKFLDQYIVGQEVAKKTLSVATYSHFKRCDMNDLGVKKSNILLIGPTGSGKTYLVQTLAKILKVPLIIITATSLTEAGYIGDDVESCVQHLLEKAGGNVSLAEQGIIFIDEIDKLSIASSETKKQVGGKGVQQALLSIIEGTKVSVPIESSHITGISSKVVVDTTNILFICGGAFSEIELIIQNRLIGKKVIGFAANVQKDEKLDESNWITKVNSDDLIEFGLIPELIGRLPVIAPLEKLTVKMLKKILIEPKDSIITQYQKLFDYDSIKLLFEEEALEEIAIKAISKGMGARSLRGILEELLLDLMFESPSDMELGEIHINKTLVEGL